jgi:hypothetical protein
MVGSAGPAGTVVTIAAMERSRPDGPRSPDLLAGPVDLERRRTEYRSLPLARGLVVEHRGSGIVGSVSAWGKGQVVLEDRRGARHRLPIERGGFLHEGRPVTLVPPPPAPSPATGTRTTASGSIAVPGAPARVARASRILVEGIHDAELVEKVWGDDLRVEGVVVEPMDGVDHLSSIIARFAPGPGRRLGVLVDHLVEGSKEHRLAEAQRHAHVLVRGHRFVDIWAAIDPRRLGFAAWPEVPRGVDWKSGICAAVGASDPPRFWRELLGRVRGYADLDPSLVGAVEELIDFVTAPD